MTNTLGYTGYLTQWNSETGVREAGVSEVWSDLSQEVNLNSGFNHGGSLLELTRLQMGHAPCIWRRLQTHFIFTLSAFGDILAPLPNFILFPFMQLSRSMWSRQEACKNPHLGPHTFYCSTPALGTDESLEFISLTFFWKKVMGCCGLGGAGLENFTEEAILLEKQKGVTAWGAVTLGDMVTQWFFQGNEVERSQRFSL